MLVEMVAAQQQFVEGVSVHPHAHPSLRTTPVTPVSRRQLIQPRHDAPHLKWEDVTLTVASKIVVIKTMPPRKRVQPVQRPPATITHTIRLNIQGEILARARVDVSGHDRVSERQVSVYLTRLSQLSGVHALAPTGTTDDDAPTNAPNPNAYR
jgi:hypothetical protein